MQHRIAYERKRHTEYYNGISWTRKYSKAKVYSSLIEPLLIMRKFKLNKKFVDSIYILFR